MTETAKMLASKTLVQTMTIVCVVGCSLAIISQAAPTPTVSSNSASSLFAHEPSNHKPSTASAAEDTNFEASRQLPVLSNSAPENHKADGSLSSATGLGMKVKRESTAVKTPSELDTQESGHYLPSAYPSATESDYGYDAGKNSYGKQASDWSLYDQGNHGLYDKYGDKAWKDQGHNDQSSHGKHDSYGNSYNSHGSGHGSGYYSRDRGYGYEKHYAYDKEVASKHHADSHNNYGSQHGLHDNYGNAASNSHLHQGHDKYGQASRYGNHGYGKRGSNLAANHDYGHNQNKAHYYAHSAPQTSYSSYGSHVPTYRSTYSDYSPQIGYPSSYPSYY